MCSMADRAENLRKQINFLTGLIENANKLGSGQKTSYVGNQKFKPILKTGPHSVGSVRPGHPTRMPSTSFSVVNVVNSDQEKSFGRQAQFQGKGPSKYHSYTKSKSNQGGSLGSLSKYSWRKSSTVRDFNNDDKIETSESVSKSNINSSDRATTENGQRSKTVPTAKSYTDSGIKKPDFSTSKVRNSETFPPALAIKSVNSGVLKLEPAPETDIAEHSDRLRAKNASKIAETERGSVKNLLVSASVDKKLKSLSNNLKDELKKTEQQIHLLKQNLSEQKSLILLKKNLTELKEVDLQQQIASASQSKTMNEQTSPVRQIKTEPKSSFATCTSSLDSQTQHHSIQFISRSPYKLVKSKTASPESCISVSIPCTKKLSCDSYRNNETKYNIGIVQQSQESKDLIKNDKDSRSKHTADNRAVFRKTKYSWRRVQPESCRKTPVSKFVKLSKYSIRRVRRSLSNQSNEETGRKGRFKLVNNTESHSQMAARFIKSKYRIHNNASPWHFMRKKRYMYNHSGSQTYPFRITALGLSKRSFGLGRKFYQRQGQRCRGYENYIAWPYQHIHFKVSRYMPPMYYTGRKVYNHRLNQKQKRLNKLKRAVPFDPKLRIDHRQAKGGNSADRNLMMINGTVYRATQRQLIKAAHTGSNVPVKQRQMIKGLPESCQITGSPGSPVKVQGVTLIQNRSGVLQQTSLKTRVVAAKLMNKSVATAVAKYRKDNTKSLKKKKYCMFYNRFGKCNRKEKCPYIHDPEKIAVCTRFLRGTCKVKDCPFSHKLSKEKMPVCSYFLRGKCNRDDCPYLHVNVNRDAEICEDFVDGYCPLGDQCKKKHTLVCPVFAQTGSCPQGNKCKLQHRKTRKRKQTQSDNSDSHRKQVKKRHASAGKSRDGVPSSSAASSSSSSLLKSWTKIIPSKGKEAPVVLDSSDEETDDVSMPFKNRKLPTYISLSVKTADKETVKNADGETKKEPVPAMKIRPQL